MKKKLFLMALTLSFSFSAVAQDLTLRSVMQKVDFETLKILQGFIWNNDLMILEGAEEIANHPMPKGGAAKYIPKEKRAEFMKSMKGFEKIVHGSAHEIIEYIKEGKKEKAFKKYTEMVQGCMACHSLFRGW